MHISSPPLPFGMNVLLFRLISAKFAIFTTNCRNMKIFHNWYLNPRSFCVNTIIFRRKLAKYVTFRYPIFKSIRIQFLVKSENYHLWSAEEITTDIKKFVQHYRKIGEFFRNGEFRFIKAKFSGKQKIFQGRSLLSSCFFSTWFLNFGCKSHHPALKLKTCVAYY